MSPKSIFQLSRYKLGTLKQQPGESVDSFVKKIRIPVEECRFTNPDEHIIDALIFGSNSKCTQTKLLDKDATLTLDTALDISQTEEATNNQIKEISPGTSTHVDALNCCPPIRPRGPIICLCGCCGTEHDILSNPFALPMAHNVVLVEKRTTGGKSVVHQSLTKKGRLSMFVQTLLNLQKGNLIGRSISIALRPVITGKTAPKHQFRISYTSIPCQLIRSPRMTLKPS